jgi:hypothetical protein
MINLVLSTREALKLYKACDEHELQERIIKALEIAAGERNVAVVVDKLGVARFVDGVRVLQQHTGWSLRDAKEWFEIVRGTREPVEGPGGWETERYVNGQPNSLTVSADKATALVDAFLAVGVVARISAT